MEDQSSRLFFAQVGSNLRRLMDAKGISPRQLADASSVDCAEIERLREGEGELLADALFLLAEALGVTVSDLASGVNWVPDRGGGEWRTGESAD